MATKWILCFLAAGVLFGAGCAGPAVYEKPPPANTSARIIVTERPPMLPVEVVGPPPGPQYVWKPGVWAWQGDWVWVPGRWVVRPRANANWVTGRWVHHPYGWVWVPGYWR